MDPWSRCATCNQMYEHCPGHLGHLELVLPVYHPLLFNQLYMLLKSMCFNCHRFRISTGFRDMIAMKLRSLLSGEPQKAFEVEALFRNRQLEREESRVAAKKLASKKKPTKRKTAKTPAANDDDGDEDSDDSDSESMEVQGSQPDKADDPNDLKADLRTQPDLENSMSEVVREERRRTIQHFFDRIEKGKCPHCTAYVVNHRHGVQSNVARDLWRLFSWRACVATDTTRVCERKASPRSL